MQSTLIYVHGTNGSGKSTLARAVVAAAGGARAYDSIPRLPKGDKAGVTSTPRGVYLLGRYERACGGVDGYSPYARVHDAMTMLVGVANTRVFAEGLITPGVETCQKFASYFDHAFFVTLNTPAEVCVRNVLSRRGRSKRVTTKEYTPEKLYDKHRSAIRWAARLADAGLDTRCLDYPAAYAFTLEKLGLQPPSIEDLLK